MCLALFKMHISIDFPVLDGFPAAESNIKRDVLFSSWQSETTPFHGTAETAAEQIYNFTLVGTATVAQAQLNLATQFCPPVLLPL